MKFKHFLENEYVYYIAPVVGGLIAWFFSGLWTLGLTILLAGLLGNWYYLKSQKKKNN